MPRNKKIGLWCVVSGTNSKAPCNGVEILPPSCSVTQSASPKNQPPVGRSNC
jgi:hypothetical protein